MTQGKNHPATPPLRRLLSLIAEDRREIFGVSFYALLNSLLLLAIPLAAQALVNVSAAGLNVQPLIVLSGGLLLGLLFAGVLNCLRYLLAEHMLQRIFSRVALRVAKTLPRVKSRHLCESGGPELMNRFFDVINIQKSWFKLVYESPGAILEIVIGLSLLALYGTELFLIAFFFIAGGGLLVALAGGGGVKTSIQESACKYRVAEWLEEMVRCQDALHLNHRVGFWEEQADHRIVDYLTQRRKHFGILLRQFVLHYLITAAGLAGMLGFGGYLVLQGQLSLGQLVAAELVIWSLFKATDKLLRSWEAYFDLLTGLDKIGYITDLPTEEPGKGDFPAHTLAAHIQVSDLWYAHSKQQASFLREIDFTVYPGERLAVLGDTGAGKSTLLRIVAGFFKPRRGSVEIDQIDLREIAPPALASAVGYLSDRNELFAGSIVDNVAVGRECDLHHLRELLVETGGESALRGLSKGGFSDLTSAGSILSSGERTSLLLSRALLTKPRLLIIDDPLTHLSEASIRELLQGVLLDEKRPTFITTSTHPEVLGSCDCVLLLERGRLVEQGKLTALLADPNSQLRTRYPNLCHSLSSRKEPPV